MDYKKKYMIAGICIGIILLIFSINIIKGMNDKDDAPDVIGREEEVDDTKGMITRAEAYRLLSYLQYDRSQRQALSTGISYSDENMSGDYDTYVNAVWKMGLIQKEIEISPTTILTYGDLKELTDKLIANHLAPIEIYGDIPFSFESINEEVPIITFLSFFNLLIKEHPRIASKTLYILGEEGEGLGRRMITDGGKYYISDGKDYTNQEMDARSANKILTKKYMSTGVKALTLGNELIYLSDIAYDSIVLYNVYIKEGKDKNLDVFLEGIDAIFETKHPLSSEIKEVVGDITIKDKQVVGISVKPDMISGKVLMVGKDYIEIEKYGKVSLDENYKTYKTYKELSIEPSNSILVGYDVTDFVVSNGKINAAIIKKDIKTKNIRVLLMSTNYKDVYHKEVSITSNKKFTITYDDTVKKYKANEIVKIQPKDKRLSSGRMKVEASSDKARIEILSIDRSSGNPGYRGTIEIMEDEKGIFIINELPIEEYLYAVIPSEMPSHYHSEALKVQAVCARSYAYKQLLDNKLSNYGAHVDDSVSYQVYNNIKENEHSILAVKDTYGEVITYDDEIITAYYFSTSCGHTATIGDVWGGGVTTPYLLGKLMAINEEDIAVSSVGEANYRDLSKEENFRTFIENDDIETYDSEYSWYRWNVNMDIDNIGRNVDEKLSARYHANPSLIQTLVLKDGKESYENIPIDTVGKITDIKVLTRGDGGVITQLLIVGSVNTIKVSTEYNIRTLLAPRYDTVTRHDLTQVENLSLLPSAFFVIDKTAQDGVLKNITFTGGGYGHGVGMSQNAAQSMASLGVEYKEVIKYFYKDTDIGFIY